MRLMQAMCGLAFLAAVATGCTSDGPTAPGTAGDTEMSMPGDDSMPNRDQEDMGMGMGGMGMPTHTRASCEASGGVCATQGACSSRSAHMIAAQCPASLSCCVAN
jgi:hypothetical protein